MNVKYRQNLSQLRMTIDTKNDYLNLKKFFIKYIKTSNIKLEKLIKNIKSFYS